MKIILLPCRGTITILLSLLVISGILSCTRKETAEDLPNIIYILIDDLGYGDLGCYGSKVNNTPAIDRMAAEGMLFSDFHSNRHWFRGSAGFLI